MPITPIPEQPPMKVARITVDMTPDQYEQLRRAGFDARIGMSAIVRGLIDRYLDDPALAAEINQAS